MSKVSVLIAIYNSEKYLAECLDSVCSQTLSDIQIICIDDCSTDSSPAIIADYAQKDKRIHVIRLSENRGTAYARNMGLSMANGEYTMMLDSDDWLDVDALERAYRMVSVDETIDCGVLRLVYFYEEEQRFEPYRNKTALTEFTGEDAFLLSLDWSLHGLYMVRTSIHKEYPYDTSCRLYSDENTTKLHYLHSRRIVLTDGAYYYRQHGTSQTNRHSILRFDRMEACLSLKKMLISEAANDAFSNSEKVIDGYECYRWLNIVDAYWYYYCHQTCFTLEQCSEIESRIASMLLTVERHRIPWSLKLKLGYYPFKSYQCFSKTANFYFALRRLLGRN